MPKAIKAYLFYQILFKLSSSLWYFCYYDKKSIYYLCTSTKSKKRRCEYKRRFL